MQQEESLSLAAKQPGGDRLGSGLIRARNALLDRLSGVGPSLVINGDLPTVQAPAPVDLAAQLRRTLLKLKSSVMDETGMHVDYAALRQSPDYAAYRADSLAALREFDPDILPTVAARRAFWINLYNALVLDAVIAFDVQHTITEGRLGMFTFFRRAAYLVNERRVSLEDMEHGILRANRGNPYFPGANFPADDVRMDWALPLDPRIHFALNCGGRSCPPIRFYAAERLDEQLDVAARGFVAATVRIRPEKRELWLSRIFQWYQSDFGGRAGMLDFVQRYLPDDDRRQFLEGAPDRFRLRYLPYDWGLNGV